MVMNRSDEGQGGMMAFTREAVREAGVTIRARLVDAAARSGR